MTWRFNGNKIKISKSLLRRVARMAGTCGYSGMETLERGT